MEVIIMNKTELNKKMAIVLLKGDLTMMAIMIIIVIIAYIVGGIYTLALLSIVWIPMTFGFMGQTIESWRLYMDYKRHDFKDRADW